MEEWFKEEDGHIVSLKDGSVLDLEDVNTFDSLFFCDDWIIKDEE